MAQHTLYPPVQYRPGKQVKVIATVRGYDGYVMREPGDVFDMPVDTDFEDAWFRPWIDADGEGRIGENLPREDVQPSTPFRDDGSRF